MKVLNSILNVREAKARFSEVLKAVSQGNEFMITSNGEPTARIVPLKKKGSPLRIDLKKLTAMPINSRAISDRLIREERDSGD